jgi:hypothetical protein
MLILATWLRYCLPCFSITKLLYSFLRAVIRKYHSLGGSRQQKCVLWQCLRLEVWSQALYSCYVLWGWILSCSRSWYPWEFLGFWKPNTNLWPPWTHGIPHTRDYTHLSHKLEMVAYISPVFFLLSSRKFEKNLRIEHTVGTWIILAWTDEPINLWKCFLLP